MTVKNWSKKVVLAATAGATSLGFSGNTNADVVIHNNGFTANNQALPGGQTYGSNASADDANWTVSAGPWGGVGAPNIGLFWGGDGGGSSGNGYDTYINWGTPDYGSGGDVSNRGSVVQLDGNGGSPNFLITFTPTAGYGVVIRSFDLDAWAWNTSDHGPTTSVDWSILDSSNNVLTGGSWSRTNGGRDTIAPEFSGGIGEALTLRFFQTSGSVSYIALDNLTFAQIPEPSAAILLTSGLAALVMRRRRLG